MTISRCFTYKTFNPSINDFDKEVKYFRKEVDKKTEKKIKMWNIIQHICLWLLLPLFIGTMFCGAMADAISAWFLIGFFCGLFLLCYCIFCAFDMENREDTIIEEFREENFEEEKAECEKYNAEQEQIALEWRQSHPFEEKIRMAKVRGSSVDIAEMIRHYEEYIKNKN